MTTYDSPVPRLKSDFILLLLAPVSAGLVLGVGDLIITQHTATPVASVANSSALWAVGPFLLAALLRTDPVRAAFAGVVMLTVAVEAYYGYATLIGLGTLQTLFSATAVTWMMFGVAAGVVFGVAGSWTSSRTWWQRVVGTALGAGVLLGEALHTWLHLDESAGIQRSDLVQSAILMVALAGCVLLLAGRRPAVLATAAAATVPVALLCSAAFSAVGIAY